MGRQKTMDISSGKQAKYHTKKTWTWPRKGNLKRETESLRIAAQNNTIQTNYIKTKIDKTQQNSKCRFCGDRNETINHISECIKLAQKSIRIVQEIWIWSYYQMVYTRTRTRPWKWDAEKFTDILKYKSIPKSQPEDETY